MIVFTGLSGSGKSSLAFDTIFAEGQRRYVESLSAYARQFLGQMDKPDVDFIDGLSPAVSIDQKAASRNPRSTVGTVTEVYDYLRLLFARIGKPHCPECGRPIARQTPQQIVDRVLEFDEDTRFQVLAPGHPRPQGRVHRAAPRAADQGVLAGQGRWRHDQARRRDGRHAARAEEVREAHDRGDRRPARGQGVGAGGGSPTRWRPRSACPAASWCSTSSTCRRTTPTGSGCTPSTWPACTTTCRSRSSSPGRSRSTRPGAPARSAPASARRMEVDPELVVGDPDLSLADGAIAVWSGGHVSDYFLRLMEALGSSLGFSVKTPWRQAPGRREEGAAARLRRPGARQVQEQVRQGAVVLHELRGRDPVHLAPARRGGERLEPGAVRRVHAAGPLPVLPRHQAEAADAGGHRRRQVDRRVLRAADRRADQAAAHPGAVRPRSADRRAGAQGDQRQDGLPARRRAGLPDPGPGVGDAGRRRGAADQAGDPDRVRAGRRPVRAGRAVDRAAPAGQPPAARHPAQAARPRQHADRGRA